MLTKFNAGKLAKMYDMSESTFHSYLLPIREELNAVATYRTKKGKKKVKSQNYNSKQLEIIISKALGDSPNGYKFNGDTFVKINETDEIRKQFS